MKAFFNHKTTLTQQIKSITDIYAVEPLEKAKDFSHVNYTNFNRKNAEHINKVIEKETTILINRIVQQTKSTTNDVRNTIKLLLNAINKGEIDILEEFGFNFKHLSFQDMLNTISQGTMPIELQSIVFTPTKKDTLGIELALLFKKLSPSPRTIRTAIVIDDFVDEVSKKFLTKEERDQYVLFCLQLLESKGVISSTDTAGLDFFIIRQSLQAEKVDELITKLRHSPKGKITVELDGSVYFKPSKEFIETLGFTSAIHRRELSLNGILIKHPDGLPTKYALYAASYLNPINQYFMHFCIDDKSTEFERDTLYVLLRAMNIVRKERYQNIYLSSANLSTDIILYGIAKLFQRQTQKLLQASSFYNEWSEFDAYEYAERNFHNNGEILPEDKQLIRHAIVALKQLGIKPRSLEKVADVGTGPNLYPAMILSPYVKIGKKLDLLEFSAHRDYIMKLLDGTLESKQSTIWHKFEEFMIEVGGDLYKKCNEKTKKIANVQYGNIFSLPESEYDVISSFFVAESIVDSMIPFCNAIESLKRAVKPGGILMIAHVLGSEEYYAGIGTHFPAISLTEEQIRQVYLDAGLEILTLISVSHDTQKFREGYSGMTLVIAQPFDKS